MSMNPHRPHDQHGTAHQPADEAEMDTFTVGLPRWPFVLRLAGHHPLVRTIDRIEALVFVLVLVVALLAAPIAAAVGTAVYDSSRQIYTEQAHSRHTVSATATDVPVAPQMTRTGTTTVSAEWTVAGAEHTGAVTAPATTKPGDIIEIWVDDNGAEVPAPTPTSRAAAEAGMGAMVLWICVAAIAAALFTGTRALCDRIRFRRWQDGLEGLVGNGDGHQHPGRTAER
jgi:hypothetical protein